MTIEETIAFAAERFEVSPWSVKAGGKLPTLRQRAARAFACSLLYRAGYQRKLISRALCISTVAAWEMAKEWEREA